MSPGRDRVDRSTADAESLRASVHRRTLRVLVVAQVFAGAGLGAGVTTGALLAQDMLGSTASAGIPAAFFTVGAAGAAILVGRLSQRSGRRPGLAAGYGAGALGGVGVVVGAATGVVPLFLLSLLLYGSGMATNLQARYAGADLATPDRRGRSLSVVLLATTVGAFVGPNLVEQTGDLALSLGLPELTGPFMLSAAAYGLSGLVVLAFLRPDPLLVARSLPTTAGGATATHGPTAANVRTLRLAAAAMLVNQLVMVGIMTMTPVYMRDHDHGLGAAGLVISIHIASMYLPSVFSGILVDRVGRKPVLAAGAATLLAAGVLAATAPSGSVALLALALGLLGVGWNLGLVAGTAMVTDAAPLTTRAKTQGNVDLVVALAGAAGGISSGVVVAATSFAVLSLAGGLLGLALLPVLFAVRPRTPAEGVPVTLSAAED